MQAGGDYFFDEWKKAIQNLNDSIEKSMEEIRDCKDTIREMQVDSINGALRGRYVRDDDRLILSAPEIIIGNVDKGGYLFSNQPSRIILRGKGISIEGSGDSGFIKNRAPRIQNTAVDPGSDGKENVVSLVSEIVSQAKGISICSHSGEGVFTDMAESGSGLHLHSDTGLFIEASDSVDKKKSFIESRINDLKESKDAQKEAVNSLKKDFEDAIGRLEKSVEDTDTFNENIDLVDIRSKVGTLDDMHDETEEALKIASDAFFHYSTMLSELAETCRQITCLEKAKEAIPDAKDFQDNPTGTGVWISSENIGLSVVDGDGMLRTNPGAGVTVQSNSVSVNASGYDGALFEEGSISLNAMNIEISTANTKYQDQTKLDNADIPAEGNIYVLSKNMTIESVDYELKDGNIEEKALTKDGALRIRTECVDLSSTDTEGKAAGTIGINAKDIEIKAMDVKKDDRSDDKLAPDGSLLLTAEKMFVGSVDNNNKTKQIQISADKTGVFGDTTTEIQQGEATAIVQLDGGNLSMSGSKTELFGDTAVNGNAEFKSEIKAPKATIDNIEAKSSFKSTNISDGVAVPPAPSSAKLSAKLKTEEKKK